MGEGKGRWWEGEGKGREWEEGMKMVGREEMERDGKERGGVIVCHAINTEKLGNSALKRPHYDFLFTQWKQGYGFKLC
jgi:hypothetical protein